MSPRRTTRNGPPDVIDDRLHVNEVKLRLTDRELVDLSRISAAEDRKPADMVRYALRMYLYGRMRAVDAETEVADSPSREIPR